MVQSAAGKSKICAFLNKYSLINLKVIVVVLTTGVIFTIGHYIGLDVECFSNIESYTTELQITNHLIKDDEKYCITGNDAYLVYAIEAERQFLSVQIEFSEKLEHDISLEIFYADNTGAFAAEKSYQALAKSGTDKIMLPLPEENVSYVRIDINEKQGEVFGIESVNVFQRGIKTFIALTFSYKNIMMIVITLLILAIIAKIFCLLNKKREDTASELCVGNKGKLVSEIFLVFVIITIMFLILYHSFIWGDLCYIYSGRDIGSDTLYQYWPKYEFLKNFAREVGNDGYSLQKGLGEYVSNAYVSFINPFDWVFLVVDGTKALILALYLKILWTSFFVFGFFKKKLSSIYDALICSILWTFGGWMILWGQHYQFATSYAYFTAIIFFIELMIAKSRYSWIMPVILAFLSGSSYYFTYMTGVFCVIYIIFSGIMQKKRIKESVVNILKLACMEMIAILLNMVQFYPIVVGFLKSARTGQLGDFSRQIFHSFADIVSYIGRIFSTNFWGNIYYSGSMNYYEMGISYLSCLGIITISYFLINKYWKRTTAAIIAYLFMISVTAVSFVLTFTNGYRWTFLLNFVLVICIGKFLDKVSGDIKQKNSIVIYKTIVMADIIFICMLSFLWIIGKKLEMTIDKKAFFQVMCVWGIANVLVFILFYKSRMTLKNIGICIVLFICAEQVFMNYDIVNDRGIVTEKELGTSLYNDGTAQIVDKLEEQDASLYRVNKTYKSVFLNDAYIQGYNGVSDYGSTHGKTLIQFMDSLNIDTPYNHSNYVDISVDEIYVNELLSVKYIIAEESYEPDKEGLIEVWSDGNKIVYEDENTLPFGYIYTKKINYEQCQELDETSERTKALMLGFYYTELTLNKDNAFETIDLSSNNALWEWKTGRDVLINSNVYDIQFRDNVYTANVINDSEKKVMFCVPFIYDENWNAYVDGIEVECYNINGGLIGIEIGNGEHNVKIVYNDKYQELSRTISAISCGIYIVFLGLYFVRQRFVVAGKIMDDKKHRKSKES